MSECTWLSDRMPSVALRQAEWTTAEARHLTECRSCHDEWELVRAGIGLGDTSPSLGDPAVLTRAVMQRLSESKARTASRIRMLSGLAAAAAISAVVWLDNGPQGVARRDPGAQVARAQMPLAELENLQPPELESVLQAIDDSVSDYQTLEDAGLVDLDSDELQQVLDSWEG
jgi:hypothetical protein